MATRFSTLFLALVLASACVSDSDPIAELPSSDRDANSSDPGAADANETAKCLGQTPSELVDCVEQRGLDADVDLFSKSREPGSANWQALQDECFDRFTALGYEVKRQVYESGVNVIATRAGTSSEQVIVSAHYDHIENCPGAADNAAGVAAVLEAARVFSNAPLSPTLVFACWDEEERGLLGAKAFVSDYLSDPAAPTIRVAVSLDSFGYSDDAPDSQKLPTGFDLLFPQTAQKIADRERRGDFIAVFGDQGASSLIAGIEQHASNSPTPAISLTLSDSLKLSPLTADLRRSDHAAFWEENIPAIHLTDTANFRNPNYHCLDGVDSPDNVDLSFVRAGTRALVGAVAEEVLAP